MMIKRYLPAAVLTSALLLLLRPQAVSVLSPITGHPLLLSRLRSLPTGGRVNEASARVAEAFRGIHASTRPPNRGPEVDEIARIMGRPQDGSGSPWCAKFASTVVILASALAGKQPEFRSSSSAASLWIGNPELRIPREELKGLVAGGASLRGAVVVRSRMSGPSSNRETILAGRRVEGHALVATGARIEDGRLVIYTVAGNTRGPQGPGSVWDETIVEGDDAWDRLAGVVFAHRSGMPAANA